MPNAAIHWLGEVYTSPYGSSPFRSTTSIFMKFTLPGLALARNAKVIEKGQSVFELSRQVMCHPTIARH